MTKNPIEFVREVRAEVAKVTWPTRRETMITTSMVFIFVVIAALFFLVADKIIGFVVKLLVTGAAGMLRHDVRHPLDHRQRIRDGDRQTACFKESLIVFCVTDSGHVF